MGQIPYDNIIVFCLILFMYIDYGSLTNNQVQLPYLYFRILCLNSCKLTSPIL